MKVHVSFDVELDRYAEFIELLRDFMVSASDDSIVEHAGAFSVEEGQP